MKKKLFQSMGVVIAICLLIPFFSGCSDDEKSTDVYYITVGQTDVNFTSNLYLQAEITDLIATTSGSNQRYKLCTESEAKSWLNQVVTEIKKPAFIADIPLLKTTFTLEATQAASDPDAKGKVVASQQITLEK